MTMYDRYDGLIFDMDGTLLDSEPTHRRAWDAVLGRYGMDYDLTAVIALNGSPTWRIAQAIIEHNQSDLDPHALAAEKMRAVESMLLDCVRPLPLAEVALAYKGRRPMAVGTGSEHRLADALLRHLGLRDCFQAIVAADDVQRHKPDPQTFLRCAALLGVAPTRCVVFEDADLGIQAARRAGMDWIDVRDL
ncbi:fructose-1-phosphate/6-phosphogluconate phosphatase [Edwardsiella anguillarum]|nr:fructose-1-phosphate/6-phosphogluconate phosphatase [Edwardsiella anguillarum]BET85285.1 fructose-1-phosphate/6-phosphogluconate phosphatase [Edwardsiella anguillarum]BET88648.1 fructose-1-phosphate/6-phosphogluconate phosphatase [Edwardsiella anguillarum]BET91940.1 fructose-1-phosphate/6-phosphogluconate phosphatase [Edwardsiella anguillarum]